MNRVELLRIARCDCSPHRSRVFANHKDLARALKRWAPKGCRLEGMILDTKGTRSFRCNAARACDHFRELERACRGGGVC